MCGGLNGWTTSRRAGSRILMPWTDDGIPEVLDQNNAVDGAAFSILGHRLCLNGTFSGPCSWTMSTDSNAAESSDDRMSCFDSSSCGREMSAFRYSELH